MMWLNDELIKRMHMEKIQNPKLELQNAKSSNAVLSEKAQKLEKENQKLLEKVNTNELHIATKKNESNTLLVELKKQKRRNMKLQERLEISRMHLEMVQEEVDKIDTLKNDALSELRTKGEKLSFKWDVVDCLEKMLVGTRLETAEQDAVIFQLKKRENDLKIEIDALRNIKPGSVSKWQREFLDARLKEADVVLEFSRIKRDLTMLKEEIEERRKIRNIDEDEDEYLSIRLNLKDKAQEEIRDKEEMSVINTIEFQDEIDRLKREIFMLNRTLEDAVKQLQLNEETKVNLHEVRSSIYHRLQRTNIELGKQIEKNNKLEQTMHEELMRIQKSVDDKIDVIVRLTQKIKELELSNNQLLVTSEESRSSFNESLINSLQDEIEKLEAKIKSLKEPVN